MIDLDFSPKFKKQFGVLSEKIKSKVHERLKIFTLNESDPILNNHQLHGEYAGCRSINITGDIRIIYKKSNENHYRLLVIGTHSQLYE
jgi:addiction module RelE/StbE family toxin